MLHQMTLRIRHHNINILLYLKHVNNLRKALRLMLNVNHSYLLSFLFPFLSSSFHPNLPRPPFLSPSVSFLFFFHFFTPLYLKTGKMNNRSTVEKTFPIISCNQPTSELHQISRSNPHYHVLCMSMMFYVVFGIRE